MYMPITDPAISIDEALRVMQMQDRTLKSFPEVEWVVGKAGRAETSTDPAPVNMNETIVHLKPPDQWRPGMTREKLIAEMDAKLAMPGVQNIWTQPIINRIEMLTTGIRTQIGVKIFGGDLNELERLSHEVSATLRTVPGAANVSPEPLTGAPYIDIEIDRQAAARYGIDVKAIQEVIDKGVGETNLTVTIEGRKRFPARVRYAPQFRTSPDALGQLVVPAPNGAQLPLSQLAHIRNVAGACDDSERKRIAARHGAAQCAWPRRDRLRRGGEENPEREGHAAPRLLLRVERAISGSAARSRSACSSCCPSCCSSSSCCFISPTAH